MGTRGSGDGPQSLPGKVGFISKVRGRLERVAVRIDMEQILLCPSVGRLWYLPLESDEPKGCPFTAPSPGKDRVPVPSLILILMAPWRDSKGIDRVLGPKVLTLSRGPESITWHCLVQFSKVPIPTIS